MENLCFGSASETDAVRFVGKQERKERSTHTYYCGTTTNLYRSTIKRSMVNFLRKLALILMALPTNQSRRTEIHLLLLLINVEVCCFVYATYKSCVSRAPSEEQQQKSTNGALVDTKT